MLYAYIKRWNDKYKITKFKPSSETQQTQNICIALIQRRPNDFNVDQTLYKKINAIQMFCVCWETNYAYSILSLSIKSFITMSHLHRMCAYSNKNMNHIYSPQIQFFQHWCHWLKSPEIPVGCSRRTSSKLFTAWGYTYMLLKTQAIIWVEIFYIAASTPVDVLFQKNTTGLLCCSPM